MKGTEAGQLKSRSKLEHRKRDNGGAVGADRDRCGVNALGMSMEEP